MSMPVTSPDQIEADFMQYDPQDFVGMHPEQLPHLAQWLATKPNAWLYVDGSDDLRTTFGQRVVVLVGEAGSGKSTLMRYVKAMLPPRTIPIDLDLKTAPGLAGVRHESATNALDDYLREAVHSQVERAKLGEELQAARVRLILSTRYHAALTQLRIRYPDIAEWPTAQLMGHSEVSQALMNYETQTRDDFLTVVAAQMMPSAKLALLVDNVDSLENWLIRLLCQKLHATHRGQTIMLVAIRAENQHEAEVLLNGRRDRVIHLAQERNRLTQIARTRNEGALAYAREFAANNLTEAAARHKAVVDLLDAIENDPGLLNFAARWLNGNVRQWLEALPGMALNLRRSRDPENAVRGILMAELVEKRYPPRLFELLEPNRVFTDKYRGLPFYYLPMRILVYVHTRASQVPQATLFADFWNSFGIDSSVIRPALEMLCTGKLGRPQLMRLSPQPDGKTLVVLLPCGEEFVQHVLYSTEYLAQVHQRNLRDHNVKPDSAPSITNLRKAVVVVREVLLPSLEEEHPYLRAGRDITKKELVRLSYYGSMFNFGKGRWFVGRMQRTLHAYATKRGLYEAEFKEADRLLLAAVRRLDSVVESDAADRSAPDGARRG